MGICICFSFWRNKSTRLFCCGYVFVFVFVATWVIRINKEEKHITVTELTFVYFVVSLLFCSYNNTNDEDDENEIFAFASYRCCYCFCYFSFSFAFSLCFFCCVLFNTGRIISIIISTHFNSIITASRTHHTSENKTK